MRLVRVVEGGFDIDAKPLVPITLLAFSKDAFLRALWLRIEGKSSSKSSRVEWIEAAGSSTDLCPELILLVACRSDSERWNVVRGLE